MPFKLPLLLSILVTIAQAFPFLMAREQSCNGSPALCSRKYSNVSLIGTHDSAFVGSIVDPRVNQEEPVAEQLDAGIRFLQAQVHDLAGTLQLCHTSCALLDAGTLEDYLRTVKAWLDGHADAVVTVLLVNSDNRPASEFDAVLADTGLKDLAFTPASSPATLAFDAWPTYGEMIASGKRFVLFLDAGADTTSVPSILPEFEYFFETPYDTTDPKFNQCTLDRPKGDQGPEGKMYIVNHFLDKKLIFDEVLVPDNEADFRTNAATGEGSIGAQAELCEGVYGRVPNVLLVDMFDRGNVFEAQRALNGL